jgi:hypothetical protein
MGNDGSKYKLVGNAWVKIVHDRQPLVPDKFEAKNAVPTNVVEGRTIE